MSGFEAGTSPEVFCPICKSSVDPTYKFCGACGAPMDQSKGSDPSNAGIDLSFFACSKCGALIDSKYGFCGNCGARAVRAKTRPPKSKTPFEFEWAVGVACYVLLAGILVGLPTWWLISRILSTRGPAASSATGTTHRISSHSRFGCRSRARHNRILGYAADEDRAAFTRGLAESISSGDCMTFEFGTEVFLEETVLLSGVVRIRIKGQTASYWTAMETID
jgi:hypothetical protein